MAWRKGAWLIGRAVFVLNAVSGVLACRLAGHATVVTMRMTQAAHMIQVTVRICRQLVRASGVVKAQVLRGEGLTPLLDVLHVGTLRAQSAAADILR